MQSLSETLFLFFIVIAQSSCAQSRIPQLGNDFATIKANKIEKNGKILIGASSIADAYLLTINHLTYKVGVTDMNKIIFISSEDIRFKTPEGITVGLEYQDVQKIASNKGYLERGWGYIVPLQSGWNAFIDGRDSISSKSKVISLFKRTIDEKSKLKF